MPLLSRPGICYTLCMPFTVVLGPDDEGRRLDRIMRKLLPQLPLSAIHRLLRQGLVLLGGKRAQASSRVHGGETLELRFPLSSLDQVGRQDRGPQKLPYPIPGIPNPQILWEGSGLLIVNKPSGILVHGPNSLDSWVQWYLSSKEVLSPVFRSGPLHRLDRGTSGIIAFSTSLEGAQRFSDALRERRINKRYLAVLDGTIMGEEEWEDTLERDKTLKMSHLGSATGKLARTRLWPLTNNSKRTLALVQIDTGRTHQIRAQASAHGYPLSGDRKYGTSSLAGGPFLHAYEMEFPARLLSEETMQLRAPVPQLFLREIESLFGEKISHIVANTPPTDRWVGAIIK